MSQIGIDAIYPASIPANLPFTPSYVFGYIDGQWPSFNQMKAQYPQAKAVSISADPGAKQALSAVVADCEEGDYSEEQAAQASAKKIAAGWTPAIYCSFSIWSDCQETCVSEGVDPNDVDWLIAAYPGIGPILYPGSPGHQWVDQGSYDQWVIQDGWQPGRPIVQNAPIEEEVVAVSAPIEFAEEQHVFQVSANTLWHKVRKPAGWANSAVIGPTSGATPIRANIVDMCSQPVVFNNQLLVTVESATERVFYFAFDLNGTVGVNELP